MLFPQSFGSFLFPLLAAMHAGQGAGDRNDGEESPAVVVGQPKSVGEATAKPLENGEGANRGAVRSPDGRLELVVRSYGRAMRELAGTPDPEGHALLQAALLGGRGDRRREPASAGNRKGMRWEAQGVGGNAASEVDEQQGRGDTRGGEGMATDRKGEDGDLMALMERTRCGVDWFIAVVFLYVRCCFIFIFSISIHVQSGAVFYFHVLGWEMLCCPKNTTEFDEQAWSPIHLHGRPTPLN